MYVFLSDRFMPEDESVYSINNESGVLRDALFVQKNLAFCLKLHYS
jgi:hypothetical protein